MQSARNTSTYGTGSCGCVVFCRSISCCTLIPSSSFVGAYLTMSPVPSPLSLLPLPPVLLPPLPPLPLLRSAPRHALWNLL